jgi:uncharacterized protein with HEPN domain
MTRREALRLADILTAIADIRAALDGIDKDRFMADRLRKNAVSMSILVISEAARNLPAELTSQYPEIAWQKVADIGSIIRHVYFRIDYEALWEICDRHLGALEPVARAMASSLDQ